MYAASKPEIKVYRLSNGYVARFINSPEVVETMGTDVIPTAFTERAEPEYVRMKLAALNPDHEVVMIEGPGEWQLVQA